MKFGLQRVKYMPKELQPWVLYYAEEYGAAAHLCACGCGSKIRTPIDEAEWSLKEDINGPTLNPSVGNWQKPCRSHYFIRNGVVLWHGQWTEAEIRAGRRSEHQRRVAHLDRKHSKNKSRGFWNWMRGFFD
jgi:hypothetical protein